MDQPIVAALADGAAGIAYFLLRRAAILGDGDSLTEAAAWAERATDEATPFTYGPRSEPPVPASSLHYLRPGTWWVRTLVAAARGDDEGVEQAAARFADYVEEAFGEPGDVVSGSAGLLLGCAQFLETLPDAVTGRIRAGGQRLADELAASPEVTAFEYLGPAHGWAGAAHALLRWTHATGQAPSLAALDVLDRLIELRRPSGRWPIRAGSREVWRGWCHGSAGWAMVWAEAWRSTGDSRFLALAEFCAGDAVAAIDEAGASLCCGRAGQGFAALSLHRATGERRWLDAAREVAASAARIPDDETAAHALFEGRLGVELLELELNDPGRSAMPVFEAAG